MIATLKFNLDDPNDEAAHHRCIKARDMAFCLYRIQNEVAKVADTSENGLTVNYEDIHCAIMDALTEYQIDLDDLIS